MEKNNTTEAVVLKKNGAAQHAFSIENVAIQALQSEEVRIDVETFGLNYADVMARNNLYREAPPLPSVLGYEVVGTICEIGSAVDPSFLGKRVVAFTRFGGYARKAKTFHYAVAEIGEMDAAAALALSTQFVTAYYMAEYLTPIHAGDRVLIHAAAGGVGTALIQLAKLKSAIVFAKIGSESKKELVKLLGADEVINYSASDYEHQLKKILGSNRLDISFNPVAGSTLKKDMRLLGSGGRLILFGGSERSGKKWGILSTLNFVRKMGLVIPIELMMRSKNILGVNMLKIADNKPEVLTTCLREVVKLTLEGKLIPQVGASFPADKIAEAHDLLESGKSTGKIAVYWEN